MASIAYNKKKGSAFEQSVAAFLAESTGLPVERRHLAGAADRGDLAGVSIAGRDVVVECKCTTRLDLAQHLAEAERERRNAGAAFGVVVQKRRGTTDPRRQLVVMSLETLAGIINAANA